jgi:hypothetical protein
MLRRCQRRIDADDDQRALAKHDSFSVEAVFCTGATHFALAANKIIESN